MLVKFIFKLDYMINGENIEVLENKSNMILVIFRDFFCIFL